MVVTRRKSRTTPRCAKQFVNLKFSIRSLLALVLFIAVLVWLGTATWRNVFGVSGTGVNAAIANRWMHSNIPLTANDVNFRTDLLNGWADFSLTEREFIEWCESNGWVVERIDQPTTIFGHRAEVGCHYRSGNGSGVFNPARQRAFVYFYHG